MGSEPPHEHIPVPHGAELRIDEYMWRTMVSSASAPIVLQRVTFVLI